MTGSQFNRYSDGILVQSTSINTLIANNFFLVGLANNSTAINLQVSPLFSIIGNSFNTGVVTATGIIGIVIGGTYDSLPGVITGNLIWHMTGYAILLQASAIL